MIVVLYSVNSAQCTTVINTWNIWESSSLSIAEVFRVFSSEKSLQCSKIILMEHFEEIQFKTSKDRRLRRTGWAWLGRRRMNDDDAKSWDRNKLPRWRFSQQLGEFFFCFVYHWQFHHLSYSNRISSIRPWWSNLVVGVSLHGRESSVNSDKFTIIMWLAMAWIARKI